MTLLQVRKQRTNDLQFLKPRAKTRISLNSDPLPLPLCSAVY